MGLPSKRRTPRSKRERASHFALKAAALSRCTSCNAPMRPHHACPVCGMYQGRKAMNVEKRAERRRRHLARK